MKEANGVIVEGVRGRQKKVMSHIIAGANGELPNWVQQQNGFQLLFPFKPFLNDRPDQ